MMGNSSEAVNVIEQIIEDEDYASRPLVSTQLAEVKRSIGQSSEALTILSSVVDGQFEPPVRTLVQYGSNMESDEHVYHWHCQRVVRQYPKA